MRKRKALQLKPYVPKKVKLLSRFALNSLVRSRGISQLRDGATRWEAGRGFVRSSQVRPRGSVATATQERRDYIRAKLVSGSNKRAKRLVLQSTSRRQRFNSGKTKPRIRNFGRFMLMSGKLSSKLRRTRKSGERRFWRKHLMSKKSS